MNVVLNPAEREQRQQRIFKLTADIREELDRVDLEVRAISCTRYTHPMWSEADVDRVVAYLEGLLTTVQSIESSDEVVDLEPVLAMVESQ